VNGLQQLFVVEWLAQESNSPSAHRSPAGFFVVIHRNENDWDIRACGGETALKLQSVHTRHSYVDNEARGIAELAGVEVTLRGFKDCRSETKGLDE
jgi:hypothetical protein